MVQQQEGNAIQLADAGEALEFPKDYATGSSQLLLSAAFLTAELALLQKSFDVTVRDRMVSCLGSPSPHLHLPPVMTVLVPCVHSENYPGVVGNTRTGRCQDHQFPSPSTISLSMELPSTHPPMQLSVQLGIYSSAYNSQTSAIHPSSFLSNHHPPTHLSRYQIFMP